MKKKIHRIDVMQNSSNFPGFFIKINKSQDTFEIPGLSRTCGDTDVAILLRSNITF